MNEKKVEDMTEAELAEYYYAHRDDFMEPVFSEEVPSRKPTRVRRIVNGVDTGYVGEDD